MAWFKRWRTGKSSKADRAKGQPRPRFNLFGGRRYLKNESYFLPKDDTEISRLDFQHYLFRFTLRGNFAAPIGQPTSILDVGCGTGRWPLEMASQFPNANVFGLDLLPAPANDAAAIQSPKLQANENYVYLQGNVLDGLPFADGTFDYVHQRLLVAGIPLARWPGVVTELMRVTRPGGWIELLEAIPASGGPAMNQLRDWLVGVGLPRGVDIRTTHQIGGYMQAAGAKNIQYRELSFILGQAGGRAGVMMTTNYFSLYQSIRGVAIAQGLATADVFDATVQRAQREIAEGQHIWPYFLAYGQKPG